MKHAVSIGVILLIASFLIFLQFSPAQAQTDADPLITSSLQRVSWGAVLAGAVVALVAEFGFNLLGFAIGVSSVNPEVETESASPKALGMGATIWLAISAFVSLFIGGWIAGHMAGMPDETDGMLHGIVMWALVTLVSLVLLASGIGRLLSGISTLVGHALSLTADVADTTAQAATSVAGAALGAGASVAGAAANVAVDAAQAAGHVAQDAAGSAAHAASTAADKGTDSAGDLASWGYEQVSEYIPRTAHQLEKMWHDARQMINEAPEVIDAEELREMTWNAISREASMLARQANVNPEEAEYQAEQAAGDAQRALRYVAAHPGELDATFMWLLRRVFRRGESVVADTDREALIDALIERSPISRDEAEAYLNKWEETYDAAKHEVKSAREKAMQRVEEVRQEAQEKINEMQHEATERVNKVRREAEERARNAAQATTNAIANIAAAVVIAMLVGAFAAGIGGVIGVPEPEDIPANEVDEEANLQSPLTTFELQ